MKVDLYTADGASAGKKVNLPADIFEVVPNDHLIYQAVVSEMSNRRAGTHSAKSRGEVSGGGAKPWRQKGTGRARAGTNRSPIWSGGGVTFPPKPHKYKKKMNKKAKRAARRSAFAYKASEKQVVVISQPEFDEPKTKRLAGILSEMGLADRKVLLLTGDFEKNLYLSGRNLPYLVMKTAVNASTYDIVDCDTLLLTEKGLEALTASLAEETAS